MENSLVPAPEQASIMRRSRLHALLDPPGFPQASLVILTLLVYARSLTLGFVYDDHAMVENPAPLTWQSIVAAFSNDLSRDHGSNFYRPFTVIWQWSVGALAGMNPVVWHLSNILLHLICVLLVFHLACRLLRDKSLAIFAAAVFAVHPTHVEAVTWVSDAGDSLLTIFVLLSALAFLRWLTSGSPVALAASLICAAGSCFVKEIGLVTPALLLVLTLSIDAKEKRVNKQAVLIAGISSLLISVAFLILRNNVLHGFAHPLSTNTENGKWLLTEPAALWFYFSHLVFPLKLGMFYPLASASSLWSREFLVPAFLVAVFGAASTWAILRFGDRGKLWFCIIWVLAPLAAPLYLKLFAPFELVHDRYLYIPSIAFAIALACLLRPRRESAERNWQPIVMLLLLAILGARTVAYQGMWKDDMTFFQHSVKLAPNYDRGWVNLGVNKLEQGDMEGGTALLKHALEIEPNNAMALFDLGNAAFSVNDLANAERYIQQAIAIEGRPKWMVVLATVELRAGKLQNAEMLAQDAIELDASQSGAHLILGAARLAQGDVETAARELSTELQMYPQNQAARQLLQQLQGRMPQQR